MRFLLAIYLFFCCVLNQATAFSKALAPFSYHGAEHKKTFLASRRVFEFNNMKKKRIIMKQNYKANGASLGSAVWDGSFVLAEYMQRKVNVENKCVVEIGCGLGLVSIVLALQNASYVIATVSKKPLYNFTIYLTFHKLQQTLL
jgi:hypothetical protein